MQLFASVFKLATGSTRHPVPDHVGETIELAKLIMAGAKDGSIQLADYIKLADVPVVTPAGLAAAMDVLLAETVTGPAVA